MNILVLETSGDSGGAAVVCPVRGVLSEVCTAGDRTHGALLVPSIDAAMSAAGLSRADLAGVAVNAGPGSYTGLRIGVAAAEAIGFVLGIPVVGVPGFEVMCAEWIRLQREAGAARAAGSTGGRVVLLPALDARQHACSAAAFAWDWDADRLTRLCDDTLVAPEEIGSLAGAVSGPGAPIFVFGQAADACRERFPGNVTVQPGRFDIRPASVGMAALRLWPDAAGALRAAQGKRIEIRYFRAISAKTIAERQAE